MDVEFNAVQVYLPFPHYIMNINQFYYQFQYMLMMKYEMEALMTENILWLECT